MKLWKNADDAALDRAAQEIREEDIAHADVEAAATRVWLRLSEELTPARAESATAGWASGGAIRECAGFTALIPAYIAKALAAPRALLLEDHMKECVACRRTLAAARSHEDPARRTDKVVQIGAGRTRTPALRWTLAAAAAILIVVAGVGVWRELVPSAGARTAGIQSVEGALYKVSGGANVPVAGGASVALGDGIRTAKASRAVVRLADGSLIEMKERSEISLSASRSETTIRLARGSIIVQAARQHGGHLYVATDDCRVAVVGTIFSVNHGSKGSRVSVIEGEVHVEQGRREQVLGPGEQVSTHTSLEPVPVREEIAWSQDASRYQALLGELKALGRELDRTIRKPSLRHSTALLDSVPAGTILYAALPNLTTSLADAHRIMQQRIEESDVLREWWEKSMGPAGADPEIEEILDSVRQFGEQLGDEIVVAVQAGPRGDFGGVLLTAELPDRAAFQPILEAAVRKTNASSHGAHALRIVENPVDLTEATERGLHGGPVLLWTHEDRFVAATDEATLRAAASILESGAGNAFTASPFRARLADAYRDGAEWLFGVDVRRIVEHAVSAEVERSIPAETKRAGDSGKKVEALRRLGILDAQDFIFESKHDGVRKSEHATLTFGDARRGLASWLAVPAPMGALDFVTSDATFMTAFVVKDPVLLLDDLYGFLDAADPTFAEKLSRFEAEQGISVRNDLAAPLGGEIAFALDGPVLPVPSWKFVMEVYDPVRLQNTIGQVIAKINARVTDPAEHVALESEESGGKAWYTLRSSKFTSEVHYLYTDGYLIAAPSRALLERAVQARESGQVLMASEKFRALLPQDGQANFSAVAFEDLGSVLSPLVHQFGGGTKNMSPEAKEALTALGTGAPAKLVYAYGEPDRIVFASTSESSFASDLQALLGLRGLADLHRTVEGAGRQQPHSTAPGAER